MVDGIELYPIHDHFNTKTGLYYVSKCGKIYSSYINDFLKTCKDKDGYLKLGLSTQSDRVVLKVATIVLITFKGLPPSDIVDATVEHIDGNRINNHVDNLMWLSRSDNSRIRKQKPVGEKNHEHILNNQNVIDICNLLLKGNMSMKEIGDLYNVSKNTISNIKRKKNWTHITEKFDFNIRPVKTKQECEKQRDEIHKLLIQNYSCREIVNIGYPCSVVYRCRKQLKQLKHD